VWGGGGFGGLWFGVLPFFCGGVCVVGGGGFCGFGFLFVWFVVCCCGGGCWRVGFLLSWWGLGFFCGVGGVCGGFLFLFVWGFWGVGPHCSVSASHR